MKLVSIGSLKTLHLFEVTPTEKCLTQRNSVFFFRMMNDGWMLFLRNQRGKVGAARKKD